MLFKHILYFQIDLRYGTIEDENLSISIRLAGIMVLQVKLIANLFSEIVLKFFFILIFKNTFCCFVMPHHIKKLVPMLINIVMLCQ